MWADSSIYLQKIASLFDQPVVFFEQLGKYFIIFIFKPCIFCSIFIIGPKFVLSGVLLGRKPNSSFELHIQPLSQFYK
jgi:hypothetical protein